MAVRVAINGFGRTGRSTPASGAELAPRARGRSDQRPRCARGARPALRPGLGPRALPRAGARSTATTMIVGERRIQMLAEPEAKALPWQELGIDVVVESTGKYTKREKATEHLEAGATRVVISAPAEDPDATFVIGVNEDQFDPAQHFIISNASCTTNCLAPLAKVLDDAFGIEDGFMTTVHAYTDDQSLVDALHKDPRRARGAAINIVPTTTGAARATGLVLPSVAGHLDGLALRVPVPDVSITDLVANVRATPSVDGDQRRLPRGGDLGTSRRAARVLRRAPRLERHRQLARLVRLRLRPDDGPRAPREGPRLVRQRVGLLEPPRGPRRPRRRRDQASHRRRERARCSKFASTAGAAKAS